MGSKEGKTGIVREVLSFFLYVAIVVGITFLIIHFVGQRTYVSGSSMENTLSDGDNLIVDKLTYRFSDPKRFDIIVFPYKYEENTYFIKRIIGLPGETIQVTDGKIYINGQVLDESYGREVLKSGGIAETPMIFPRIEAPNTPATGPDSTILTGVSFACSNVVVPPLLCMM